MAFALRLFKHFSCVIFGLLSLSESFDQRWHACRVLFYILTKCPLNSMFCAEVHQNLHFHIKNQKKILARWHGLFPILFCLGEGTRFPTAQLPPLTLTKTRLNTKTHMSYKRLFLFVALYFFALCPIRIFQCTGMTAVNIFALFCDNLLAYCVFHLFSHFWSLDNVCM